MVAKSPEVLNIVPKTDGNDRKEQYESSDNNLEKVKWVEKQISHELQNRYHSHKFFGLYYGYTNSYGKYMNRNVKDRWYLLR